MTGGSVGGYQGILFTRDPRMPEPIFDSAGATDDLAGQRRVSSGGSRMADAAKSFGRACSAESRESLAVHAVAHIRNPFFSGSSSSIRNVCSPVIQAEPSISGTIAWQLAHHRSAPTMRPLNRVPIRLSCTNGPSSAEQAHRVDHRHHRRGARAAGRAIHFGVGEDRDVAQVGAFVARRPGEDRAVDARASRGSSGCTICRSRSTSRA